jgi:hypothetical protein
MYATWLIPSFIDDLLTLLCCISIRARPVPVLRIFDFHCSISLSRVIEHYPRNMIRPCFPVSFLSSSWKETRFKLTSNSSTEPVRTDTLLICSSHQFLKSMTPFVPLNSIDLFLHLRHADVYTWLIYHWIKKKKMYAGASSQYKMSTEPQLKSKETDYFKSDLFYVKRDLLCVKRGLLCIKQDMLTVR